MDVGRRPRPPGLYRPGAPPTATARHPHVTDRAGPPVTTPPAGTGILAPPRSLWALPMALGHRGASDRCRRDHALRAVSQEEGTLAPQEHGAGSRHGGEGGEDLAEGSRTGVVAGGGGGEVLCDCTTLAEVISAYVASAGLAARGTAHSVGRGPLHLSHGGVTFRALRAWCFMSSAGRDAGKPLSRASRLEGDPIGSPGLTGYNLLDRLFL